MKVRAEVELDVQRGLNHVKGSPADGWRIGHSHEYEIIPVMKNKENSHSQFRVSSD